MSKKNKKQKQDALKLNILKTLDLLEEDDAREREEERMEPGFSVDYRTKQPPRDERTDDGARTRKQPAPSAEPAASREEPAGGDASPREERQGEEREKSESGPLERQAGEPDPAEIKKEPAPAESAKGEKKAAPSRGGAEKNASRKPDPSQSGEKRAVSQAAAEPEPKKPEPPEDAFAHTEEPVKKKAPAGRQEPPHASAEKQAVETARAGEEKDESPTRENSAAETGTESSPEEKPPLRRPGVARVEPAAADSGNFVIRKTATGATLPVRAAAQEGEPVVGRPSMGTANRVGSGSAGTPVPRSAKKDKAADKSKKKIVDLFDKSTKQETFGFRGWFERPEPLPAVEHRSGGDTDTEKNPETHKAPDSEKKTPAAVNPVSSRAEGRRRGAPEKKRMNLAVSSFSADYRMKKNPEADPNLDNETEIDDFLADGNADDTLLVKGAEPLAEEEAPAKEEPSEKKASSFRHGKYRYGIVVGSLVLLMALVGVAFIAGTIGRQIYQTVTDDSQERAYDTFLAPVVMQDPDPFEDPAKADEKFILNASLWKAITANEGTNYSEYDENGRALVPLGDVVDACHELFGPNCQLQPNVQGEETFYEYNSTENKFHVALYSSDSTYTPYTESIRRDGDGLLLRVGYVSPSDEWRNQTASGLSGPTPVKYMNYSMKQSESTGKYYIYAIQTADP